MEFTSWFIIRHDGAGTWEPWGRLEPNNSNAVGYRFEVLPGTAVLKRQKR
ncbi:hypothetical protein JHK82_052312 [Glycine max]|nr:hypothetical protein JHK82_052312 [Glycine max]